MSNEYTIYRYLKEKLKNDTFSFSFQDLGELTENACGIYLLGSITTTRSLSNLNIKQYNNQLVFNVNSTNTQKGFENGYNFCNEIVKTLMGITNETYENIFISHFELTTSTAYLGRNNEKGLNKFSLNFVVYYTEIQ